jgi:hypothetical protein
MLASLAELVFPNGIPSLRHPVTAHDSRPQRRHRVPRDDLISRDQPQLLLHRLRHEQAIERIAMQRFACVQRLGGRSARGSPDEIVLSAPAATLSTDHARPPYATPRYGTRSEGDEIANPSQY